MDRQAMIEKSTPVGHGRELVKQVQSGGRGLAVETESSAIGRLGHTLMNTHYK
jgi:hypothetical protein